MKTKEFIKQVEALGWFVEKHLEETFVVDYLDNASGSRIGGFGSTGV